MNRPILKFVQQPDDTDCLSRPDAIAVASTGHLNQRIERGEIANDHIHVDINTGFNTLSGDGNAGITAFDTINSGEPVTRNDVAG